MEKIAFICNDIIIYWSSIVLALAALTGILVLTSLWLSRGGHLLPVMAASLMALVLSVLLARLIHWYCYFEQYESFAAAFTDFSVGGYSIVGVFFGCILAAIIVRVTGLTKELPSLLDCMAPAGAAAIGVGRLWALFNAADKAKIFIEHDELHRFPFAAEVTNTVSGEVSWRFATFAFQSIAAFVIFAAGVILVFALKKAPMKRERFDRGNVFWLSLLFYCCTEAVLDSTRYDAVFIRSNGFVSLMQICCLLTIVLILVIYSVRSIKGNGLKLWHFGVWLGTLGALGGAGYMEYYVQRHGHLYVFSYSVMSACMLVAATLVFAAFLTTVKWGAGRGAGRSAGRHTVSACKETGKELAYGKV